MDGTLWLPLLDLCQVNNNYYSKTNSERSDSGSGRVCSSQKLRHNCHFCHSSGFQKYEEKYGKSYLQTLAYAPVDDNSVNHPSNTCSCQKVRADVQKVYLLFCILFLVNLKRTIRNSENPYLSQ